MTSAECMTSPQKIILSALRRADEAGPEGEVADWFSNTFRFSACDLLTTCWHCRATKRKNMSEEEDSLIGTVKYQLFVKGVRSETFCIVIHKVRSDLTSYLALS